MRDPDPSDGPTVADLVDTLSVRADLLGELYAAEGPLTKRTLVDRLDVSRSTVNRGVRRLRTLGIVTVGSEGVSTTASGELVCREYLSFAERLGAVLAAQDPIDHLPPDAPLSVEFLRNAEVVTATDGPPHAPGSRVNELVESADRVTGLARANATPQAGETIRRRLDAGATVDMVFDREMFDRLVAGYDWAPDMLATDRFTARVHDDLPYGLFLVSDGEETVACLLVYDEDDLLTGVVVADDDPALAWARTVVEEFRREATRPSLPE